MTDKLFGTDGIRGKANQGVFTPELSLKLGRAIGQVAKEAKLQTEALIAHDGRRSAGLIGDALTAGLLASGFNVQKIGLITTPGLAYLTRVQKSGIGIMISASHNPAEDNGIKIFGPGGSKLSDEIEAAIERSFFTLRIATENKVGIAQPNHELAQKYLEYLQKAAVPRLSLKGFRIVIDCANGAASEIATKLFKSLGASCSAICNQPNGDNINHSCGALYPQNAAKVAARKRADIGISLDGDGDRSILCDEKGRIVDGDGILTVIAQDLIRRKKLPKNTVVTTVMSNFGLGKAAEKFGVKLSVVGVGDRKVVEELRRGNYALGGEQSGHIIFGKDNHYIGDGLYTALRVLDVMKRSGKKLSELSAAFQTYPQVLKNIRVSSKPPLETRPRILESILRAETRLKDSGRVLVRYSGTESLARVMVEGPNQKLISEIAEAISAAIQSELS